MRWTGRYFLRLPQKRWPFAMKTRIASDFVESPWKVFPPFCLLLLVGWTAAAAQENHATPTAAPAPTAAANVSTNAAPKVFSPGVGEIMKLADAGVSTLVIRSYIETSPITYRLTEADVIGMKVHHVPDEIVTLLLRRSAGERTARAQAQQNAAAILWSAHLMASGGFDPDSYDYFQYNYLQPRTLAAGYQQFFPRFSPAVAYGMGYAPGWGFGSPYGFWPSRPHYPGWWRN